MKSRILFAVVIGSALAITQTMVAADKAEESKYQAKCPVSGQPAKADKTVEFNGGKVQFCCENCPKAFQADTKKYAAKASLQMVGTGELKQVACPYSGKPVNPEAIVEIDGVKVGFCCNNCKGKTEKADDKVALAFADISKGFTAQTKCPVSDKPIDVTKSVDYKGGKVYFCCANCPKAFEKDPAKFADKLPKTEKK